MLWDMTMTETIVLASASPRRKAMFDEFAIPVEVIPADIEEVRMPDESPVAFALRLAGEKGLHVATALNHQGRTPLVVAADTIVVHDDRVLGKPVDADDAKRMLRLLSGKTHSVVTAWAVGRAGEDWTVDFCDTKVRFYPLSPSDIDAYVASGECFDKAGAYAIQGRGSALVERIEGSYSNVVGLPAGDVLRAIAARGVIHSVWKP